MASGRATLGKTYEPFGIHLGNPVQFYAQLRREEPVTYSPALNAYLVSRYEDVLYVLSHPDLFSSRDTFMPVVTWHPQALEEIGKGYPPVINIINSDGANHIRFREPLQKAFTPARINGLEPFIRQRARALIESFLKQGKAEMVSQFATPLPLEVILTMLGIPLHETGQIQDWCNDWAALFTPLSVDRQVACVRSMLALQQRIDEYIEMRIEDPRDDLISLLATTLPPGGKPYSRAELIYTLTGLIMGGHENTSRLIGNGLVLLLEEPERWQALHEHPEWIPPAVEEMLRYHSPLRGFTRTVTRPTILGDIFMPRGTRLFLLFGSANRDEARFKAPDQFEITRSPNRHLAFGYGVHVCLGLALGRLEGRIAFETLTGLLPASVHLVTSQLRPSFDFINSGYERIEVAWEWPAEKERDIIEP